MGPIMDSTVNIITLKCAKLLVKFINVDFWDTFILRSNSRYKQTINYDFCLNKLLICCLLIVSMVVVKFRY